MIPLTIFTPTYNRATLLSRCFESLKRQTCKQFIWMIIDDGSTDSTAQIAEAWAAEPLDFEIVYVYKKNGGLHTAYNTAIANIKTELCVCIDSDDFMPENAVEQILNCWRLRGSDAVAGIVGLDYDLSGHVIGDCLPDQNTVNLIDLLTGKYHIKNGDRTNVVRTELYRKYAPMKEFPGEKNFNPHYLHLQISNEYDFLVLNKNLRYVDYQPCGMSASIWNQYRNSPNSFIETRRLYLSFPNTSFCFQFKQCIHYVSSNILAKKKKFLRDSPAKVMTVFAIPLGTLLAMIVCYKTRSRHLNKTVREV